MALNVLVMVFKTKLHQICQEPGSNHCAFQQSTLNETAVRLKACGNVATEGGAQSSVEGHPVRKVKLKLHVKVSKIPRGNLIQISDSALRNII